MKILRSPTERTLRYLRKSGYTVQVVEVWSPFGGAQKPDGTSVGVRRDLFGFIDVLAVLDEQTLAVQCSAVSGIAPHYRKIVGTERIKESDPIKRQKIINARDARVRAVKACLAAGWDIAIFGFDKGMRVPKARYITEADFSQQSLAL